MSAFSNRLATLIDIPEEADEAWKQFCASSERVIGYKKPTSKTTAVK